MRQIFPKGVYGVKAKHINRKIATFRKAIQRIDEWEEKIKMYHRLTKGFFGTNVLSLSKQCKDKKKILAKYCFCKICLEHKLPAAKVAAFLKMQKGSPLRARKILTISFATNKDNRSVYHNFLKFVEDASNSK